MAMSEIGRWQGFVIGPRIPGDLAAAVEGLAREVLRHRPQNIYAFAAHHFEQLIKLREEERIAGIAWTDRDKNVSARVNDPRNRSENRRIIGLLGETEPTAPTITTKLSRRRKGTSDRSGWSIDQTIRAFKRHLHEHGNEAEKEKLGNKRMPAKVEIPVEIAGELEFASSNSIASKKLDQSRFLRSSSTGDIFSKTTGRRRLDKNGENLDALVADKPKTRGTETDVVGDASGSKRQKSADQIGFTGQVRRYSLDRRSCDSLASETDGSKGSSEFYGEERPGRRRRRRRRRQQQLGRAGENSTTISRNRTRSANGRDAWTETQRRERNKSGEIYRNAKQVDVDGGAMLNSRSGKGERKLEENGRGGSRSDSTREEISENVVGTIKVDERIFDGASSMNCREDSSAISVILPSVLARPSSTSSRYSKTGSLTDLHEFTDANSPNNLTLPPISSEAFKAVKKENVLQLPLLSSTIETEVRERLEIENEKKDSELEQVSMEREKSEATNYDCCSNNAQNWSACSDTRVVVVVVGNKRERQRENRGTSETVVLREDIDGREAVEQLEFSRGSDLQNTMEVEEMFKDSLNVTPDSIEFLSRPDSLEHSENEKQQQQQQQRRQEEAGPEREVTLERERRDSKSKSKSKSNELKKKLIEIETAERNIESALASAPTTHSLPVKRYSSDSEGPRSVGENESILIPRADEETYAKEKIRLEYSVADENSSDEAVKNEDNAAMEVRVPESTRINVFHSNEPNACFTEEADVYVLTEGSPYEIPESVTTVIIPDKIPGNIDSVSYLEVDEETRDEPQRGCDKDPFGEYVFPESFVTGRYSSNIDVSFLRDIKDAVDRTVAVSQDLGNIQEEEEETDKKKWVEKESRAESALLATEDARGETTDSFRNTIDGKNDIEWESETSSQRKSSWNRSNVDTKETLSRKAPERGVTESTISLNDREETTASDRSCGLVDSFGAIEPYVPELSFDSLRDATISSSKTTNSKATDVHSENDIQFREGENALPSADDAAVSLERRTTIDEDSAFSDRQVHDTKGGKEIQSVSSDNEFEEVKHDINALVRNQKSSSSIEAEIARDLIQNLPLDASIRREGSNSGRADLTTIELDPRVRNIAATAASESVDSSSSVVATVRCSIEAIHSREGIDALENRIAAEGTARETKALLSSDSIVQSTEQEAAVRKIQSWIRKFLKKQRNSRNLENNFNTRSFVTGENVAELRQMNKSRKWNESKEIGNGGRSSMFEERDVKVRKQWDTRCGTQTGEFHDSLVLPVFEMSNSPRRSGDACTLNDADAACVSANRWVAVEFSAGEPIHFFIDSTGSSSALKSHRPASTGILYTVDLSQRFRSVQRKPVCSENLLNFFPTDALVSPFARTIFHSVVDDAREPLTLREPQNSIFIEEISNVDEENSKQTSETRSDHDVSDEENREFWQDTLSTSETSSGSILNEDDTRTSLSPDCFATTDDKNTKEAEKQEESCGN